MNRNSKVIVFIGCLLFVGVISPRAYAYIDVSATTYIVQIIAGAVVVLGTIAGVAISSIKKKAKEKLNIDLDKKEQEEDIVVYDDEKTE